MSRKLQYTPTALGNLRRSEGLRKFKIYILPHLKRLQGQRCQDVVSRIRHNAVHHLDCLLVPSFLNLLLVQNLLYLDANVTGGDIEVDMVEYWEAEVDIDMADYIHCMSVVSPST